MSISSPRAQQERESNLCRELGAAAQVRAPPRLQDAGSWPRAPGLEALHVKAEAAGAGDAQGAAGEQNGSS